GNLDAVFDLVLNYAKERKQFGKPIGSFPVNAHTLADMQTEIEAPRMLVLHSASTLDKRQNALPEITIAKLFACEADVRIVNQGMQLFGGYGYNMEYDMQRYFRDARASTIGAGSSQMQRNLLASLMGLKVK